MSDYEENYIREIIQTYEKDLTVITDPKEHREVEKIILGLQKLVGDKK